MRYKIKKEYRLPFSKCFRIKNALLTKQGSLFLGTSPRFQFPAWKTIFRFRPSGHGKPSVTFFGFRENSWEPIS